MPICDDKICNSMQKCDGLVKKLFSLMLFVPIPVIRLSITMKY